MKAVDWIKKDFGFKIALLVFILLAAVDFITTGINGDLVRILESNPLYQYGGIPIIILLNVVMVGLYYYWYSNSTNATFRFIIMFSIITVSVSRLFAIRNALEWYFSYQAEPIQTMTSALKITTIDKIETVKRMWWINIIPTFNAVITWIFFKIDHKVEKHDT